MRAPRSPDACRVVAVTVAFHTAVAAASHVGHVRHENQDAWSYSLAAGLFVVCDGMGGAAGGEIASRTAVEAFVECLGGMPGAQRTQKAIAKAVCTANRRVLARAAVEPALNGMGTTLVALVARGATEAAVVHVGDSRCYRWQSGVHEQGVLTQCTEDHSLIAEQLRMGLLTERQAATSPMRHVITRAVGLGKTVETTVLMLEVVQGDVFLLCSDGLTRELEDAAIAAVLRGPGSLEMRNQALVTAALAAGGRDNVTSMLVEVGSQERTGL
jgi:serine/threonine protein phosphatase PrpC